VLVIQRVCVGLPLFESAETTQPTTKRRKREEQTHEKDREKTRTIAQECTHIYMYIYMRVRAVTRHVERERRERTTFLPNTFSFNFVTMVRNGLVVCIVGPDSLAAIKQL
jgi:hypothetical protein